MREGPKQSQGEGKRVGAERHKQLTSAKSGKQEHEEGSKAEQEGSAAWVEGERQLMPELDPRTTTAAPNVARESSPHRPPKRRLQPERGMSKEGFYRGP